MGRTNTWPSLKSYKAEVLADGPVAYWKLDELSGTTAADSSLSRLTAADHIGTPTIGVSGAFGRGNYAITFDGVDDGVKHGASVLSNANGGWTIEAWVYPTVIARQCVFQNGGPVTGYGLELDASNNISIFTRNVGQVIYTSQVIPINSWSHIATADNGTNIIFWYNGQYLGLAARQAPVSVDATESNIGRFTSVSTVYSRWFTGKIDEVAMYNKVLTTPRVRAHYLAGKH